MPPATCANGTRYARNRRGGRRSVSAWLPLREGGSDKDAYSAWRAEPFPLPFTDTSARSRSDSRVTMEKSLAILVSSAFRAGEYELLLTRRDSVAELRACGSGAGGKVKRRRGRKSVQEPPIFPQRRGNSPRRARRSAFGAACLCARPSHSYPTVCSSRSPLREWLPPPPVRHGCAGTTATQLIVTVRVGGRRVESESLPVGRATPTSQSVH